MSTFSIYTKLKCFFDTVGFFQIGFHQDMGDFLLVLLGSVHIKGFFMYALRTFASHREKTIVIEFEDYCTHGGETLLIILRCKVFSEKNECWQSVHFVHIARDVACVQW
jgi:hypothetical protein